MTQASADSVRKFDAARAGEYAVQSRVALAGYDACHELAACLLAADLGSGRQAHVLVAGAGGTAQEIICAAKLSGIGQTVVSWSTLGQAQHCSLGWTPEANSPRARLEHPAAYSTCSSFHGSVSYDGS